MSNELAKLGDISTATLTRGAGMDETVGVEGFYTVRCYGADGNLCIATLLFAADHAAPTMVCRSVDGGLARWCSTDRFGGGATVG